ncbi:BZ3500_MvSof-1268-A1-R1_Chr5-2g07795 [Microbotryum saponariae]|uniref:BZ3500_MvSof-1268-A1-R1_Chr5-2g07795 protein n=1 Tax=Microbotryum saponariae TaxID=289078 RepID=A0A2X0KFR0_9BASI|nr:BZ3500_MvSof-1268-A1-R1_Chr5-2g07795 [Microbotryum saponariae]
MHSSHTANDPEGSLKLEGLAAVSASLDLVQAQVYYTQDNLNGFKIRAIVLLALNGGVIILSVAYLAVLEVQRRRVTPSPPQWLYQFVGQPPGDLLVMNARIISATLGIISSTCWIFIILDALNQYIEHRNPTIGGHFVRAFVMCPMFVHGWVASWFIYTTYILTNKSKSNHTSPLSKISSATVNLFFAGLGLSAFLGCIAIGVWQIECVSDFWSRFRSLTNLLSQLATAYPNGISPTDSTRAVSASAAFSSASDKLIHMIKWYFILLCIPASLVYVFSLTGLGLARHLGAHIELSKKGLMRSLEQEPTGEEPTAAEPAETGSAYHDPIRVFSPTNTTFKSASSPPPHSTFILPKNLSLDAQGLRFVAQSSSLHRKRAETLVLVSKARSELIVLSSFISANAVALVGMLIYSAYAVAKDQTIHGSWIATEVTTVGAAWISGISSCCATLGLIRNLWHYRTLSGGTPAAGLTSSLGGGEEMGATSQIDTLPRGTRLDPTMVHRHSGIEHPFQTFEKEREEPIEHYRGAIPASRSEARGGSDCSEWLALNNVRVRDGTGESGREKISQWDFGTAESRR